MTPALHRDAQVGKFMKFSETLIFKNVLVRNIAFGSKEESFPKNPLELF